MKTGKRFRVHKHECLLKSDPTFIALLTPADLWVTPQVRSAKGMEPLSRWATKLRVTKPFNKAAVAMAQRLARLIWILLTRQEHYSVMEMPSQAGA